MNLRNISQVVRVPGSRFLKDKWLTINTLHDIGNCSEWSIMSRLQDYHSRGTKLFLGGKGDLGVGPEYVQEGDVVCILFGGRAPFVLRRCLDHFHLIGECYVPFWMTGR